jgi:hypothetical protein
VRYGHIPSPLYTRTRRSITARLNTRMEQSTSDLIVYSYISKNDEGKLNVTVQMYNMSTETLGHDERIYRKQYEISNIESVADFELTQGQAVYGDIVDDKFKIASVKVDNKNYEV